MDKVKVWPLLFVGLAGLPGVSPAVAAAQDGVYGAWDLTVGRDGRTRPSWVKLFRQDGKPVAEFVGSGGGKHRAKDVEVDGNNFAWTIRDRTYRAELVDGKLKGRAGRGDQSVPFVGQRIVRNPTVAGTWEVKVELGDRTLERVLQLEREGTKLSGTYGGADRERKISKASFEHGRLRFSFDIERDDGDDLRITYDVKVQGDRFAGKAGIADSDRNIEVSATRRRQWAEPIRLFNGKDLANWDLQGRESFWTAQDGVMENSKGGANLFTKQKFSDFKLKLEVKVPPHGNSGIYLRGRYEVQVADSYGRGVGAGSMGAIYGRAVPTSNATKPAGQWQTVEIRFVDYWATVVLNGTTIVDNVFLEGITGGAIDSNESEPGPILLQGDHGPIAYRNVVLTPLKRE